MDKNEIEKRARELYLTLAVVAKPDAHSYNIETIAAFGQEMLEAGVAIATRGEPFTEEELDEAFSKVKLETERRAAGLCIECGHAPQANAPETEWKELGAADSKIHSDAFDSFFTTTPAPKDGGEELDLSVPGEMFDLSGTRYYVGWMRSKMPGENAFGMWLNEQPSGGFKWEFLDYKPADEENYTKIYIMAQDPRAASPDAGLVEAIELALKLERCRGTSCPTPMRKMCNTESHQVLRAALSAYREKGGG